MEDKDQKIQRDQFFNDLKYSSKNLRTGVAEYRDEYATFQFQLITMAGAAFSIWVAFGKSTSSPLIKWGFVVLAISLICGLLSIIMRLMNKFWHIWFQLFDLEKTLFGPDAPIEIIDLMKSEMWEQPKFYDDKLDPEVLKGERKTAAHFARAVFTKWTWSIASLLGICQMLAILVSACLLLFGFWHVPVIM